MNIGNTIREIRRGKNLTQEQLALAISSSQTYLSQIEKGYKIPSVDFLEAIAHTLKTPLPVIMMKSMNEEDIPTSKVMAWREIHDPLMKLINDTF